MNYCYYLSLCPGVDRFIHQLFTAHMTAVPGIVPGSRDVVPEPVACHPVAKTHNNIEPEVVMRATNQSWAGHGVLEWTSIWGVLYWKSLSKEWPAEIWVNTGSNTPLYGKNILSGEKCKFSAHRCMWSWTEWKSKRTGWYQCKCQSIPSHWGQRGRWGVSRSQCALWTFLMWYKATEKQVLSRERYGLISSFLKTDSSQHMENWPSGRRREIPEGERPIRTECWLGEKTVTWTAGKTVNEE